jgi:hypothetical protein
VKIDAYYSLKFAGWNGSMNYPECEDMPKYSDMLHRSYRYKFLVYGKVRTIFRSSDEVDQFHQKVNALEERGILGRIKRVSSGYWLRVESINPYHAIKEAKRIFTNKFTAKSLYYGDKEYQIESPNTWKDYTLSLEKYTRKEGLVEVGKKIPLPFMLWKRAEIDTGVGRIEYWYYAHEGDHSKDAEVLIRNNWSMSARVQKWEVGTLPPIEELTADRNSIDYRTEQVLAYYRKI